MAGFTGMDTTEIRRLSDLVQRKIDEIEQLKSELTNAIGSAVGNTWKGPDADRFKSEWDGQHVRSLETVKQALGDLRDAARRNAEQQDQAST